MKMRAALSFSAGRPLDLVEVDLAPPEESEVLVRMVATGLCHSDLAAMAGHVPRYPFPMVPGHEGAGVVVACGPGVTGLTAGDSVVLSGLHECGQCQLCRAEKGNLCMRQGDLSVSRLSRAGVPITAFSGTATFAEYTVVRQGNLVRVRSDAPADVVCYVGCGVQTGIGAVLNTGQVTRGSTVAVFGLGGIGLNCVQGARIAGAAQIIGIDTNPAREAMARTMGATGFVHGGRGDDVVARIRAFTGGLGVDFSFDCVGAGAVSLHAVEATNAGWGVAIGIGMAEPGSHLPFDPMLFFTGRTWKGSMLGGERARHAVPRLVDWYMDGILNLDELITHRIAFDDINRGFDMMRSGEAIRSVVVFAA